MIVPKINSMANFESLSETKDIEQSKNKNTVILVNRKTGEITTYIPKDGKIPIFDRIKIWVNTTFNFDRTIESAMAKVVKTEYKHILGELKAGKNVDKKIIEEADKNFDKLENLSPKQVNKLEHLSKESKEHLEILHAYSDIKTKLANINQGTQGKIAAINDFVSIFSTNIDKLENNKVLQNEIIGKMQETLSHLSNDIENATNDFKEKAPNFSNNMQMVPLTEWIIIGNTELADLEKIQKSLTDPYSRPKAHFEDKKYSEVLKKLNSGIEKMKEIKNTAYEEIKDQVRGQVPFLLKQSEEVYSKAKLEMLSHLENNEAFEETLLFTALTCLKIVDGQLDESLSNQINNFMTRIREEPNAPPFLEAKNLISEWKENSSGAPTLQLLDRAAHSLTSPFGKEVGMLIGEEMKQEAQKLREQSSQAAQVLEKVIADKESQYNTLMEESNAAAGSAENNKRELEKFASVNNMDLEIEKISTFTEKIEKKINENIASFQKQESGLEPLINERNQLAKESAEAANEFLRAYVKEGGLTTEFKKTAILYDKLIIDLQNEMKEAGVQGNPLSIKREDLIREQIILEQKFDKEMELWKNKFSGGKANAQLPDNLLKEMDKVSQSAETIKRLVDLIQKRDKIKDPAIIGYVVNSKGARIHTAKEIEFRTQLQTIQKEIISRTKALQVIKDINYSKEKLGQADELRQKIANDMATLGLRKQELSKLRTIEEELNKI
ncbi:MAG: hypothetical protein H0V82_09130 [Candidatus Protochlamydia sp.]|nr:hypothetical protein [Candidatus Protochlamydia sp.]